MLLLLLSLLLLRSRALVFFLLPLLFSRGSTEAMLGQPVTRIRPRSNGRSSNMPKLVHSTDAAAQKRLVLQEPTALGQSGLDATPSYGRRAACRIAWLGRAVRHAL